MWNFTNVQIKNAYLKYVVGYIKCQTCFTSTFKSIIQRMILKSCWTHNASNLNMCLGMCTMHISFYWSWHIFIATTKSQMKMSLNQLNLIKLLIGYNKRDMVVINPQQNLHITNLRLKFTFTLSFLGLSIPIFASKFSYFPITSLEGDNINNY
jgi:hypothetical protein